MPGSAKAVGQYDIRAGIDKILMQLDDFLRRVFVPKLRRLAGFQPHGKQVGACCAIGEQNALFGDEFGKRIGRSGGHGEYPKMRD